MQLHERLLGASFTRLPPALRSFLAQPGGTAEFALQITRQPGFLRNALASMLRLPAAAARAPGTLVVSVCDDREIWVRMLPDRTHRSVKWIDAGRLVEQTGPLQLVFSVDADERGLRYSQTGCRLLGRSLPRALAPRVEAMISGNDRGWEVWISVAAPVFGLVATYGGSVTPRP